MKLRVILRQRIYYVDRYGGLTKNKKFAADLTKAEIEKYKKSNLAEAAKNG